MYNYVDKRLGDAELGARLDSIHDAETDIKLYSIIRHECIRKSINAFFLSICLSQVRFFQFFFLMEQFLKYNSTIIYIYIYTRLTKI